MIDCTTVNHLFSLWSNWCFHSYLLSKAAKASHDTAPQLEYLNTCEVYKRFVWEEHWSKQLWLIYLSFVSSLSTSQMTRYSTDPFILLNVRAKRNKFITESLSMNNLSEGGINTECRFSSHINHVNGSTCLFIWKQKTSSNTYPLFFMFCCFTSGTQNPIYTMSSSGISHLVCGPCEQSVRYRPETTKYLEVM